MESSSRIVKAIKTQNGYTNLDTSNGPNSATKYSDLDESLKFVQSLVSHRLAKPLDSAQIQAKISEVNDDDNMVNGERINNEYQLESYSPDAYSPQKQDYYQYDINQDSLNQEEQDLNQMENNNDDNDQNLITDEIKNDITKSMSVEERLMVINNVYKERRQNKIKQAEAERHKLEGAKKPTINKKSEKMLENKGSRVGKIEDRLMRLAKKGTKKGIKESAKGEDEKLEKSIMSSSSKNSKPSAVVNRLMDYGNLYRQKKIEKEEEFKRKQTFKPNLEKKAEIRHSISSNYWISSREGAHHEGSADNEIFLKYGPTGENPEDNQNKRQDEYRDVENYTQTHLYNTSFKEPSQKMQKIQEDYDKKHPFYPNINSTSKTIVEKKTKKTFDESLPTDVHNRLYNTFLMKRENGVDEESHKPEINKNSEEIIRLMREGNDYDKQNRWKTLYNYGVEKQMMRKHIENKVREIREEEELNSHPYKPQILPYDQERSTDEPKDVVERTKEWATSMECKKEVLTESHYQNKLLKEYQECTFKPRLIAEEKLKERNMTTSEISAKVDIGVSLKGLENFYRRMEKVQNMKKEEDDYKVNYCGSGKNWTGKLTMPAIPDFNEKKEPKSLEQVRCLTKPVIRNGEIVKDPQIVINRHDKYTKSELTNILRGEGRDSDLNIIKNKNETHKEKLFDEDIEFDD